jgi:3-phenylpropionate/trans-cinnamate dioxygenase ferredoxin subunit
VKRVEKHVVARVRDVPDGSRLIVDVGGRSVGIFNVDGEFYALLNRCPHNGAELCKGEVVAVLESSRPGDWRLDESRKLVACPWHGWEYDLATGESWCNPLRTRARPYGVGVEPGEAVARGLADGTAETGTTTEVDPATHRVKGPFTAEVLPVAVEDDYLVISLRAVTAPR